MEWPRSLSSQEASVDFRLGPESHVVAPGDAFAKVRVVLAVEIEQLDLLASDCVANEKVEPLPLGITSQDYRLPHDAVDQPSWFSSNQKCKPWSPLNTAAIIGV